MRVAFSPLPQQPLNNGTSTVEEAVKIYNGEEDLGATIAVLLNLLQDDHLRLAAVYDLINLSNDLCTIDESNALFKPPISSPDKEEGEGGNGDKIRVHAFTEVVRILRKQSNDKNTDEGPPDVTVQIPSRRSLLALQLGVWTALQRLVPMVTRRGDSIQSTDQRNYIELINTLISSSKSTSLLSPRPSSYEPRFLDWSYSRADAMIHSLLLLRTKMAVV